MKEMFADLNGNVKTIKDILQGGASSLESALIHRVQLLEKSSDEGKKKRDRWITVLVGLGCSLITLLATQAMPALAHLVGLH